MRKLLFFALPVLLTGLFACNKSNDDKTATNTAKVSMHLTDGPAAYDAIYLNVQQVQFKFSDEKWITYTPEKPGVYDILKLRNGLDMILGTMDLPAGKISEMRLILGDGNYITVNGKDYPLNTPSAEESGLKLKIKETLVAGTSYDFWIDFDAARSIHQTGNGKYMMKPVMRAYSELTNGRIKGYVMPLGAAVTVNAIVGTDTLSAIPNADGYFAFTGLDDGNYQLWLDADGVNFQDQLITNVNVKYGVITDVGTITLLP